MDEIIFGSSSEYLDKKFSGLMSFKFEISLLAQLKEFLGLQIIHMFNVIFISQTNFAKNLDKRFHLDGAKYAKITMSTTLRLIRDDVGIPIKFILYHGNDW